MTTAMGVLLIVDVQLCSGHIGSDIAALVYLEWRPPASYGPRCQENRLSKGDTREGATR